MLCNQTADSAASCLALRTEHEEHEEREERIWGYLETFRGDLAQRTWDSKTELKAHMHDRR